MKKESISTGKKLLLILFFSISLVCFGLCLGTFIRYIYILIFNQSNLNTIYEFLFVTVCTIIIGILAMKLLMFFLIDYKTEKKEKDKKWYIDKILITFIPVWVVATFILMAFSHWDDNLIFFYISLAIYIIIGISICPNAVLYALKDSKNWKSIFYKKGNLGKIKKDNSFYRMETPISFERKILFVVIKKRFLNFIILILCLVIFAFIAVWAINNSNIDFNGGIIHSIIHTKAKRGVGFFFFGLIFLGIFSIPILAYYVTNVINEIKVILKHDYIAYHAIVNKVEESKIRFNRIGVYYQYDYYTCVGIRAKKINNTESILIFLPDDLLIFPVKKTNKK